MKVTTDNIHEVISPEAEAAIFVYCLTNLIPYDDVFIARISMFWPHPATEFHLVLDKDLPTEVTIAKFRKTINEQLK